jgi:hypothetical protein
MTLALNQKEIAAMVAGPDGVTKLALAGVGAREMMYAKEKEAANNTYLQAKPPISSGVGS